MPRGAVCASEVVPVKSWAMHASMNIHVRQAVCDALRGHMLRHETHGCLTNLVPKLNLAGAST
jgi:hypothetical protein